MQQGKKKVTFETDAGNKLFLQVSML